MNYMNQFNNNCYCRKFEDIDRYEAKISDSSNWGGLIFGLKKALDESGEPIIYKDCSKFDVNSFYPSLFLDKTIKVPFKCGKFYKTRFTW